jgi:hypothetical protein
MPGDWKKYNHNLNTFAKDVSKQSTEQVNNQIYLIDKMNLPNFEKALVKGTIFKNLSTTKRKALAHSFGIRQSHFGNLTPGSNAALTQVAQTMAAQTMAAQTMAQTAMATPMAAPMATPGAVPSQPGFVPAPGAIPGPGAIPTAAPSQNVIVTGAGVSPVTDYGAMAGNIQQAEATLAGVANSLTQMTAAQQTGLSNLSGFGRRY